MKAFFKKIISVIIAASVMVSTTTALGLSAKKAQAADVTDFNTFKTAVANGGTVTISSDITLTETINVTGTVIIKSQGSHQIKRETASGAMFSVSGSGSLTLDGSSGTLTIDGGAKWGGSTNAVLGRGTSNSGTSASSAIIYIDNSAAVTLNSGVILQNNYNTDSAGGGAIAMDNSAVLNVNGAIIRNNYGAKAGAVKTHLNTTVNIKSGEIYGNQAGSHGGAMQLYGRGRTSESQIGKTKCNISGGYIHNNLSGGVGGAIAVSNYTDLSISGSVKITDNKTTDSQNRGGGIGFIDQDTTLTIAGDIQISGNMSNNNVNNLAVGTNSNNKIKLGSLTSNANIGITYNPSGVNTSSGFSETSTTDYSSYFFSDKSGYKVIYKSQALYMQAVSSSDYVATYQTYSGGTWLQSTDLNTALNQVYSGGTIKLLKDVTLEKQYGIFKNITITSDSSASPRTMTRATDKKTNFNVNDGGTLSLKDIIYDGAGKNVTADAQGLSMFRVPAGGTLNLKSGCVIKNNYKNSGSGNVSIYGTMTMESGASINGCEVAGTGGAIWISDSGTFTMNGGTISGCNAGGGGAAISSDGTFVMNSGTISANIDNSANKCDVLLRADKSGNVTLKGGSIAGNDNSVYNNGMTVTVAGNCVLSGKIYSTSAISASGSTTSNYSIQMSAIPADKVIVKGSTDTTHYSLANEGYALISSGENLIAGQPVTVTYNYGGATGGSSSKNKTVYVGGTYGELPSPTKTGYNFSGWFTASSGGTQVTSSSTVTNASAHTIYARWNVCSHTWNSGTVTKQPTCTAEGTKEFTCTKCGQSKTENVDKKPHTVETDKAVEATCTATGLTEGSHCSVCQTVIKAQQRVDMKPHTPEIDPKVEPTCIKTGLTEGSHCSVCNTVITKQTVIPVNGHTWSNDYQHTAEQHWKVCDVCKTEDTKAGHVWDDGKQTKPATEYEEGEMLYKCTLCEQTRTEPISKLSHSHKWSEEWSKDNNYHWHECTECKAHEQDIAHNWEFSEVIQEPSCTEYGTAKYVCHDCGMEKTEDDIPPAGHKYSDVCEHDENNHWHLCTVCKAEVSEKEEHQWDSGTIKIPSTCTDKGVMEYKCTVCGYTRTEDILIESEAHNWGEWNMTSLPTKEMTGIAQRVCRLNDSHIEREELPVLTNEDFWTKGSYVEPKCTEDGSQVYACVYGEVTEVIPLTDHVFITDVRIEPTCEDTGLTEGSHCEVCGDVLREQEIIPANGHNWNEGEITKQPAADSPGEKLFTCRTCGQTKTETIPATGGNPDEPTKPSEPVNPGEPDEPTKPSEPANPDEPDNADDPVQPAPDSPTEPYEFINSTDSYNSNNTGVQNQTEQMKFDNGSIIKDVQPGVNTPKTELATPLGDLIGAVLTRDEQKVVSGSSNIKIILTVDDGTKIAPAEDKEAVESVLSGMPDYALGQYLDINLLKIIGNVQERVSKTNDVITVTFEVPEALRGTGREYVVIRVHDGETTILADMDSDDNTVTIQTDRFSTYALAFGESVKSAPKTQDALPPVLPAVISAIISAALLTLCTKHSKEKITKE